MVEVTECKEEIFIKIFVPITSKNSASGYIVRYWGWGASFVIILRCVQVYARAIKQSHFYRLFILVSHSLYSVISL
jgi:hypothetical protein